MMTTDERAFARYALYFVPPMSEDWAAFGARWLGWDAERGSRIAQPALDGFDLSRATDTPRRYGLHATLKPPFRLQHGQSPEALSYACAQLAASRTQVTLDGLDIAALGRFLALLPRGNTAELNDLAAACVRELDGFRAPASDVELERRRARWLTPTHEANLARWGYPYVMDAFRFHLTLTGKLDKPTLAVVRDMLQRQLGPLLPDPFVIRELALMGEAENGYFHLIRRFALSG